MNPFVEVGNAIVHIAAIERPWDKNNLFDAQKVYEILILTYNLCFLVPFWGEQSIRRST
jgi:hypothetical protein